MPQDDLTAVQRYALVTLMIKATPVPNTVFTSLKKPYRDQLISKGYVVLTSERPIILDLTQKGHDRAAEEFGNEPPPRAGAAGVALYAGLEFFGRWLEHTGMGAHDLFKLRIDTRPVPAVREPAGDLDDRIRKAYSALAPKSGDFIMLAELRDELRDVSTADLDAALINLNRAKDVSIVPESNQKVLTDQERAAAVSIGNQHKHLLAIR
jgi:hypothetical protein